MKITRVLCPTDLSEASGHAAELAVVIAGYYKASITALHVLSPIVLAVAGPSLSSDDAFVPPLDLEHARQVAGAQFASGSAGGTHAEVLVDVGEPASRILDRAARLPADLIVMGTHGASGFQHFMLGSVTEKVLRTASCPVITVPPRAPATSHLPFRRVLCAIDFSDSSLAGLQFAMSLTREADAALTLLHVLEWPWEEPPAPVFDELPVEQALALADFRRYMENGAQKRLQSLIPGSTFTPPVATRLRNGKPYVQILDVAAEERADVIVIGVNGRNTLDLAVFGSTTNQVVRRATCPVVTLRQ